MLLSNILIYIVSFICIWFGSGLIVSSIDKLSHRLKLSSFIISFLVLGLLTSTPEFAVGLTAISENDPEVFVGNLLGGIPVIFLFVIPLLAILGNGIKLRHEMNSDTLIAVLATIIAPSVIVFDKRVTNFEGLYLIGIYILLIYIIQKRHGFFTKHSEEILNIKAYSYKDILKVLAGMCIVFVTSNVIVDKTLYLSQLLKISPFVISLIALSFGTNLPEISLAIRSVLSGKKDVAFGDYMGSAAANTALFGLFTLLNNGEVITADNFIVTFCFIVLGLILFYFFSQSEKNISRKEGVVLLMVYIAFILSQTM